MQRCNKRCACFRSVNMMPLNSTATVTLEVVYYSFPYCSRLLKPKTQDGIYHINTYLHIKHLFKFKIYFFYFTCILY